MFQKNLLPQLKTENGLNSSLRNIDKVLTEKRLIPQENILHILGSKIPKFQKYMFQDIDK
jgi:hypothetical protein